MHFDAPRLFAKNNVGINEKVRKRLIAVALKKNTAGKDINMREVA